jgi:hypothetical protein
MTSTVDARREARLRRRAPKIGVVVMPLLCSVPGCGRPHRCRA